MRQMGCLKSCAPSVLEDFCTLMLSTSCLHSTGCRSGRRQTHSSSKVHSMPMATLPSLTNSTLMAASKTSRSTSCGRLASANSAGFIRTKASLRKMEASFAWAPMCARPQPQPGGCLFSQSTGRSTFRRLHIRQPELVARVETAQAKQYAKLENEQA